ncbi:MAG: 3-hydroxyacyl-ACP dehydratase FabZ [Thermodesulfobacteriota bacterium]|nr:3-hydroxyacyl-ACP dehydratase FabZ [Thermodesulfobacteriota bacterium]
MNNNLYINDIFNSIPHRYPFLLVDRILEIEPGKRGVGIKNFTINEPFFQGHFPELPIVPGVLIIEAMAQVAGVTIKQSNQKELQDKVFLFAGIERARFRKPVIPGDQVRLETDLIKTKGSVWKFKGRALVGETLVAEAELTATISDKNV